MSYVVDFPHQGNPSGPPSMGQCLYVAPRHVAYILSQLAANEKMVYPWHRVIAGDRSLGTMKTNPDGRSQAELLREEGALVSGNRVESEFDRVVIPAEELRSGLTRQVHPAEAPVPKQKRSPPRAGSSNVRRRRAWVPCHTKNC